MPILDHTTPKRWSCGCSAEVERGRFVVRPCSPACAAQFVIAPVEPRK